MTAFDRAEEIAAWLGNLHPHQGPTETCAIRDRIMSAIHEELAEKSRLLEKVESLRRAAEDEVKRVRDMFLKHQEYADLQKEAKEQKLHRICQLIEAVPCICCQLPTFQQCKRCRIIELLAGEPGSSFTRVCTRDMKCPVTGHYHPQNPDLDEQT